MFRIDNLPVAEYLATAAQWAAVSLLARAFKTALRLETPMTSDESLQFLEHLRRHDHLVKSAAPNGQPVEQGAASSRQQSRLWELTDLSASDFADEAARFARLEHVALQELLSAPALNETFSHGFCAIVDVFLIKPPTEMPRWRLPIRPTGRRSAPPRSCCGET